MKLLVVVPFDLSTIYGGARTRILNDLKALKLAKFSIEVLFPTKDRVENLAVNGEWRIRCITFTPTFQVSNLIGKKATLLSDIHTLVISPFFYRTLRKNLYKYDVIMAHYPYAAFPTLMALKRRRPCILVNPDFQLGWAKQVTRSWFYHQYIRFIEKYSSKNAERTLCVSRKDREDMIKEYSLEEDRVLLLPNHIDVRKYATQSNVTALRKKYGFSTDDFLVIFHGAIDSRANLDATRFLIEELAPFLQKRAPDVKMLIVGARVPRFIRGHSADQRNVLIFSDVPDIFPFLRMSDAMVAPILIGGGTRIKILEAFASRIPVIATAEAIEGLECCSGVQVLIAERDARAFAEKIVTLEEDSSLRRSLSAAAFSLVQNSYDIHVAADMYESIINDLKNL